MGATASFCLQSHAAAAAEVDGAELVVGEVGEAVQPEAVAARAGAGVVRVDEAEVVPERAEPALALAQRVVRLAVARQPEVVRRARLRLRPRHAARRAGAGRSWRRRGRCRRGE